MSYEKGIDAAYRSLGEKSNLLYDFVINFYDYMYTSRSYGTEQEFTMMEIHTLTHIEETPGVTVTELAQMWHKTKSAVSQVVKKLVDNGYVEKRKHESNSKTILLYVTEKGRQISYVHKAYDVADITQTTNYLVSKCGAEDVEAFYRVLDVYTKVFKEE